MSSPHDDDDNSRKRPSPDASSSSSSCKRPKPAATEGIIPDTKEENDEDVLLSWLTLDEQDVTQLMDFLSPSPPPSAPSAPREEDDAPSPPLSKVRFADNPREDARLEVIRSSSAFITIDLNEESCGSSFSEFESSVMSSFDRCGNSIGGGGAWAATAADMAFWCAWTGVSGGVEAVVVSSGTHCGGDGAPQLPWDGDGGGGL
ncbi:hypothetical protein MLD38_015366 [Melastoma candidum]|uniref:Uncharacterized protein n=1 Tax=Melastoma candidum TaxID=119954 RepID=A0ACB9RFQ8_9MYRT|nr:hypothetical protein MLD38_015366 [Melastoma candidum]